MGRPSGKLIGVTARTPSQERFAVVGGGILGLAAAREILLRRPTARVTVLEKEDRVGSHQTGHNSGVIHAGVYYPIGSLKARLCAEGRELMFTFCRDNAIEVSECGKLVVAREESELAALAEIETRARANEVPGLRRLDRAGMLAIEPAVSGVAALHSPRTAVVDFALVAQRMAEGLDLRLGFQVASIRRAGPEVVLTAAPSRAPGTPDATRAGGAGEVVADRVIICAGLQSDQVARLAGDDDGPDIVPFRGEYWKLVPERSGLVNGLVYPVPDPRYPFLGVHFTKRIDGSVDLGPNAVLALAREGYRRRDVDPRAVLAMLRRPGFRRMAAGNWRAGARELRGSLSKRAFVDEARRLVPAVRAADVVRAPSGVRAQAVDTDGTLVDDFRIGRAGGDNRILTVRNAPSPAATSSMAIARYVVDQMGV